MRLGWSHVPCGVTTIDDSNDSKPGPVLWTTGLKNASVPCGLRRTLSAASGIRVQGLCCHQSPAGRPDWSTAAPDPVKRSARGHWTSSSCRWSQCHLPHRGCFQGVRRNDNATAAGPNRNPCTKQKVTERRSHGVDHWIRWNLSNRGRDPILPYPKGMSMHQSHLREKSSLPSFGIQIFLKGCCFKNLVTYCMSVRIHIQVYDMIIWYDMIWIELIWYGMIWYLSDIYLYIKIITII